MTYRKNLMPGKRKLIADVISTPRDTPIRRHEAAACTVYLGEIRISPDEAFICAEELAVRAGSMQSVLDVTEAIYLDSTPHDLAMLGRVACQAIGVGAVQRVALALLGGLLECKQPLAEALARREST